MIGMVFIVLVVAGVPCMIMNSSADNKGEWDSQALLIELTPGNFGKQYLADNGDISTIEFALHCVCVLFIMVYFPWIKKKVHEKESEIDIENTTPADFTMWVKNVPKEYEDHEFKDKIEALPSIFGKYTVVSIVKTYDIEKHMKLSQALLEWKTKKRIISEFLQENPDAKPTYTKCCCCTRHYESMETCNRNIRELKQQRELLAVELDQLHTTPIVFVSFKTQTETRQLLEYWERSGVQRLLDRILLCFGRGTWRSFKGKYLRVSRAPEPTDVYWDNLNVSLERRIARKFVTLLANVVVLLFSFAILFAVSSLQSNQLDEGGDAGVRVLSLIISFLIMFLNFLLGRIVRWFAEYEKHHTITESTIAMTDKLIVAMTLNTVMMPLLVNFDPEEQWFVSGGLVADVFWILIVNSFILPVMHAFPVIFLVKTVKRWLLKRSAQKDGFVMNQDTANSIFEGNQIDMANYYAHMVKALILALVYSPIFPVGLLLTFVGFLLEYCAVKYHLLRIVSRPVRQGADLSHETLKWVEWAMFIYAIGIYLFFVIFDSDLKVYASILLVIALLYFLFPINAIFKVCFKDRTLEILSTLLETDPYNNEFKEQYPNFFTVLSIQDYERSNPATAEIGWKRWNNFIENQGTGDPLAENLKTHLGGHLRGYLDYYASQRRDAVITDELDIQIGRHKSSKIGYRQTMFMNLANKAIWKKDVDKTEKKHQMTSLLNGMFSRMVQDNVEENEQDLNINPVANIYHEYYPQQPYYPPQQPYYPPQQPYYPPQQPYYQPDGYPPPHY